MRNLGSCLAVFVEQSVRYSIVGAGLVPACSAQRQTWCYQWCERCVHSYVVYWCISFFTFTVKLALAVELWSVGVCTDRGVEASISQFLLSSPLHFFTPPLFASSPLLFFFSTRSVLSRNVKFKSKETTRGPARTRLTGKRRARARRRSAHERRRAEGRRRAHPNLEAEVVYV